MKIINVNASEKYNVVIGSGILKDAGSLTASAIKSKTAAIICDSNVGAIYASTVEESFKKAGINTVKYIFPAGETSKCPEQYIKLLEFLAENHLTRKDAIVAVGGGVTGDLAGFAAATYLRGISLVQIPTSLLAAVDSSVGGKNGIDLTAGKNLAGAFYQPDIVICDVEAFKTLPKKEFISGMAEVIKYGVISDKELFDILASEDTAKRLMEIPESYVNIKEKNERCKELDREFIEEIVARCVAAKAHIVEEDEFEGGLRKLLNYGHTAAHAIEKLTDYEITHGEAVGAGMVIAVEYAEAMGKCSKETVEKIKKIIDMYKLPGSIEVTAEYWGKERELLAADKLTNAALSDKKVANGSIDLILPEEIGQCVIENVDTAGLKGFFEGKVI